MQEDGRNELQGDEGSQPAEAQRMEVEVPADAAGERFDRFVARVAGIGRHRAMELLNEGLVRAGRRRLKKGERAEAGMKVSIELPGSEAPVPQPELPLVVLHEDAHFVALDKPAGISMHPLKPGETGTLANAVLARFPDVTGASPEERCPGLVHRLDRDTSGVVLWARTRAAWDNLRAQFTAKTVEKRYFALVEGFVEGAGELAVPLAHDPSDPSKMVATPYPAEAEKLRARPAVTLYRTLGQGDDATLLELKIPTGVMHQIRAHVSFTGHPVVGDALYGGRPRDGLSRHWLHAASLRCEHPNGGQFYIESPLPRDLLAVLNAFGIHAPGY